MKTAYATTLTHGDAYAPGVEALGRSLRATGTARWCQPRHPTTPPGGTLRSRPQRQADAKESERATDDRWHPHGRSRRENFGRVKPRVEQPRRARVLGSSDATAGSAA